MAKPKAGRQPQSPETQFATVRHVTYTLDPQYRTVYTNNASMSLTAFDVQFIFGEMVDSEGENVTVEKKVKIAMSPQHAKILTALMVRNIQQYEKQFGTINLTPEDSIAEVKD
ncbi:MAG: DUF3467 domain-containing protein [Candidatus Angelobacter sp.]